jgi:dTDP-4-dehydrorhamnose reductase
MRLLVIGADGQIGWELARSLMPLGDVIAMDRRDCDPGIILDAMPDVLINAAGYTAVDNAEDDETLATLVNGTAVGVMAEAAHRIGALFVHYSTDYVFDGTKDDAYVEDDAPCPLNAYGRSKLAGEIAVRETGGDHLILRTSWVYAARGRNFLKTILRLARERDELRVVADQIGAPTWARDIADATARIIRSACRERSARQFQPGTLHMAAAGATSWHGFAQAIVAQGLHLPQTRPHPPVIRAIASRDYPSPAARPKNSRLCCDRLRERFDLALPDWRQGLALCLADPHLLTAP